MHKIDKYFFDVDSIFPLFVLFILGQARYVRPQFLNTMFDPSSPGASATSPGNFYYYIAWYVMKLCVIHSKEIALY